MKKKRLILTLLITAAVLGAGISIALFTRVPIPADAEGQIRMYSRNKPELELTVAVISPEGTDIRAYGHDGARISVPDRVYEIGDITKTFTGAIAAKAVSEGKLSPNNKVADILPLSRAAYSPSFYELFTHSSAYSDYAPDLRRDSSLSGINPYSGIDANELVSQMNAFKLTYKPPYLYSYSNFGAAAAGAVISQVYNVDFYSILTIFAQEELGLKHTFVSLDNSVENGWSWLASDAYIASSSLSSTIGDMVAYARLYLNGAKGYLKLAAEETYEINAENNIGYFWNITNREQILWHSGETAHYASSIMIDRRSGVAVVVLSNYTNDRYGNTEQIARTILTETKTSG